MQQSGGIIERLLGFLEVGKDHVTAEAIIQIAHVLRCFPDIAEVGTENLRHSSSAHLVQIAMQ